MVLLYDCELMFITIWAENCCCCCYSHQVSVLRVTLCHCYPSSPAVWRHWMPFRRATSLCCLLLVTLLRGEFVSYLLSASLVCMCYACNFVLCICNRSTYCTKKRFLFENAVWCCYKHYCQYLLWSNDQMHDGVLHVLPPLTLACGMQTVVGWALVSNVRLLLWQCVRLVWRCFLPVELFSSLDSW